VAGEVGGRGDEGVEAIALGGVLVRGEGTAVALDEAGDTALGGLDLVAELVALLVDDVIAIAQIGAWVLDDEDLIFGAVDNPAAGRRRERRGGRVLRSGERGWGCNSDGQGADAEGQQPAWRRDRLASVIVVSRGCVCANVARAADSLK
jgi:hypothetical protein